MPTDANLFRTRPALRTHDEVTEDSSSSATSISRSPLWNDTVVLPEAPKDFAPIVRLVVPRCSNSERIVILNDDH